MSDNKNLWKIYTDLEDETPLVAVRCRDDGVRDLEDPVEGTYEPREVIDSPENTRELVFNNQRSHYICCMSSSCSWPL